MTAEVENISPVKTKLSIDIPADEVNKEEAAAFNELRRTAAVPGFRKGKAPIATLKRIYGSRVRSDVVGRLIEKSYIQALQDHNIFPVTDADIELQSGDSDENIAFTAVVEVRPTVDANAYKGHDFKKVIVTVDEIEVDGNIEKLRAQKGTFEPTETDYAAANGDMVVMDFEGFIDGEAFEGGKGEDRPLVLGSGMFIPGFEDGLLGAKAEEERTITVTFPEDYRAENLAGKEAQFKVSIKEVKSRALPELDDEFAKGVADVETLEELRDQVREQTRLEREAESSRQLRQQIIDTLLESHPFEVPESMIREQHAASTARLSQDLTARGMDLDALGLNDPKFFEVQRRNAERAVRWAFLLRAIAEAESVEVTDADLDQRIQEIAEADGRPVSLIRSFFEQGDQMDALRSSLLERLVLEKVENYGTVVKVDASEIGEGERE